MDRAQRAAQIEAARSRLRALRLNDSTAVIVLARDIEAVHMGSPGRVFYSTQDIDAIACLPSTRSDPRLMQLLVQHPNLSSGLIDEIAVAYRAADDSPRLRAPGWAGARVSGDHVCLLLDHPNLTRDAFGLLTAIRGHAEDGIQAVIRNDPSWMSVYLNSIEEQTHRIHAQYLNALTADASREQLKHITAKLPLTAIGLVSLTTSLPASELNQLEATLLYMMRSFPSSVWDDRGMALLMLMSPSHPFAARMDDDTAAWLLAPEAR